MKGWLIRMAARLLRPVLAYLYANAIRSPEVDARILMHIEQPSAAEELERLRPVLDAWWTEHGTRLVREAGALVPGRRTDAEVDQITADIFARAKDVAKATLQGR